MEDSIFTKIINGEIPSHKVYEDDQVYAFLDIHPIRPGHVLVIPKNQVNHFDEMPGEDYHAVFAAVRKVAGRIKEVLGAKRACVRIEGFDVPHAHVHVYPCDSPQEFYGEKDRGQQDPDHEALAEIAKKLAF